MENKTNISDAEWEVMEIIWNNESCTSSQIIKALAEMKNWSPATIKTLLSRLVKKGVIDYKNKDRARSYFALVEKNKCLKQEGKLFLKRFYKGSLSHMLANFLEEEELTDKDIHELKNMLDQYKD